MMENQIPTQQELEAMAEFFREQGISPHANILTEAQLTRREHVLAAAITVGSIIVAAAIFVGCAEFAKWIWRAL